MCQQRTTCFKFYSCSKQIRCGIMLSEAGLCNTNPTFVGLKKIRYKPEHILKWTGCLLVVFAWYVNSPGNKHLLKGINRQKNNNCKRHSWCH